VKNDEYNDRPDTVKEVVESCQAYWVLSGLPRQRVNEMKLELEQHLREALADGKTVEVVVGADVNAFAAAWMKEVRTSKTLGEHILDWSFLLLLAAMVVLPWQHLVFRTTSFPVYWGTLAAIGLIILGTRVLLKPGLLSGALFRSPQQWRKILAISIFWVFITAISVFIWFHMLSGRQPVLFYWPWPATVVLVLLAGIVSWIAFRRDPTRPLPFEEEENEIAAQETTSSFSGKCKRIWISVGPYVMVWGVIADMYLIGREFSREIDMLVLLFWLIVVPASLRSGNLTRKLTLPILPFIGFAVTYHLSGIIPWDNRGELLDILIIPLLILLTAGTYWFLRRKMRLLFWTYLIITIFSMAAAILGWLGIVPWLISI
jgi:DNA-binding ferritin-like protein (Dps family)